MFTGDKMISACQWLNRRGGRRLNWASFARLLAMALGRIRAGQPEHLRSLIKPP